ncbi:MAG TPA: DAK2 domain-containing protein [Clostridia bacterium]|nr:DAK2 domain-containing protein [Clostridia bacterium]
MTREYIDGNKLREMFLVAAQFLENNKLEINALNVFPVPDGDTGTNMSLTMIAAVKEIQGMEGGTVSQISEGVSKGALKGARGNSGVILSQLFRGFSKSLQGLDRISTRDCAEALQEGAKTAYKAVMKPVEGTMLTVARVTGEQAIKLSKKHKDFDSFSKEIIKVAKETLDKTPDMLLPLKEAGVVDSGGMGVLYILMGAVHALNGGFDPDSIPKIEEVPSYAVPSMGMDTDIKFSYCTEFLVKNLFPYVVEGDIDKLKNKLSNLGDSIVVVGDNDLIKVHVHTDMPGKALQLALRFGELSSINIDNMREQHRHIIDIDVKEKKFGIVAVAMGKGIEAIFKDLSADYVIEGGQTMNPSIDDILKAIDRTNAKNVFVLPNNSNIILSAKQAQEISKRNVIVIPSKSIPQGLAAILAFNHQEDIDSNVSNMTNAMKSVNTGQITYAVRDSENNGINIKKDDIIGLVDGKIAVAGKDINEITISLLEKMLDEDSEIITLLYGQDVDPEQAGSIVSFIEDNYPDLDIEMHSGGQPLYYYILSVE